MDTTLHSEITIIFLTKNYFHIFVFFFTYIFALICNKFIHLNGFEMMGGLRFVLEVLRSFQKRFKVFERRFSKTQEAPGPYL